MRAGIAIPHRNHGRVLARLLGEVIPQEPDEIVVMDDASDDGSDEVAARYPEVRLIRMAQKTPDHNNAVADFAAEMDVDYVTMAGADDHIYDGFFWEVRKQNAGVVFCNYDVVSEAGAVIGSRPCGFATTTALSPEQVRERLLSPDCPKFECGVGSAVRMDAHKWLLDRGGHLMGPWNDSIGYSVAACIFGAAYVPKTLAAFTVSDTGSNWHAGVLSDPARSEAYRTAIMEFFRQPDVYALGPQLLSAIATRWGA